MADIEQKPAETKTTESVSVPPKKKSNKTLWIVLGVVLLFVVVIPGIFLTVGGMFLKNKLDDPKAGEKFAESLVERATGENVDIDTESGSVTAKSKDGNSTVGFGDQKLPDDFPKAATNYLAEKSVTFVITSKNENKQTWSVTTTVGNSYSDTVKYFESKIISPDYTDTSTFGFGDSQTYYGKKDNMSVSITVSKPTDESGDTIVSYIVTEE